MRLKHPATAAICAAILLYLPPYIVAWRNTGQSLLAPLVSDHTYFYILSSTLHVTDGFAENPWYKISFPEHDNPYRRYGGAGMLFRALQAVEPRLSPLLTVAIWNAFWAALTAAVVARLFCARQGAKPIEIALAVAIVICISFPHLILALGSIRSGSTPNLSLPFIRMFYPQTIAPIATAYVLASIDAMRRPAAWVSMALFQTMAMVTFPYAVIILAATTALVAVFSKRMPATLLLFAVVCALIDTIILMSAGSPNLGAGGVSVLAFNPHWPNRFQLALSVLCGFATLLVLRLEEDRVVRDVLCAFGTASAVIPAIADTFVSKSVEASIHLYYLSNLAIAILVGWSAMILATRRITASISLLVVMACGIYASARDAIGPLAVNRELGDVVRWSSATHLSNRDLVIAPSEADDTPASYLPLLGSPNVLFYYYGEYFVPADDPSEQWERLSLYLHLKGETAETVRKALHGPDLVSSTHSFMVGHRWLRLIEDKRTHDRALSVVEAQLVPRMRLLDEQPQHTREWFRRFARIFLIEDVSRPTFSRAGLGEFCQVISSYRIGSLQVWEAIPR